MKHKVSDLDGVLLDAAVAKAAGEDVVMRRGRPAYEMVFDPEGPANEWDDKAWKMWLWFSPSDDWSQAGAIIEREQIMLEPPWSPNGRPRGAWLAWLPHDYIGGHGDSPLVAAMRAYVASKFGEEVEL